MTFEQNVSYLRVCVCMHVFVPGRLWEQTPGRPKQRTVLLQIYQQWWEGRRRTPCSSSRDTNVLLTWRLISHWGVKLKSVLKLKIRALWVSSCWPDSSYSCHRCMCCCWCTRWSPIHSDKLNRHNPPWKSSLTWCRLKGLTHPAPHRILRGNTWTQACMDTYTWIVNGDHFVFVFNRWNVSIS